MIDFEAGEHRLGAFDPNLWSPAFVMSSVVTRWNLTRSTQLVLLSILAAYLLVLGPPAVAAELRLDDSAWLARAAMVGIEQARKTADSLIIKTSSSPSFEAYVIFPVEHQKIDPREFALLEITMKTNPRIHNFMFLWKLTEAGRRSSHYFLQPIYRDGEFHTYLIALSNRPSWTGDIVEIALGWTGSHGLVEIKEARIRKMALSDRPRELWSQFWIPQTLKASSAHVIAGPILFGHALAFPLALFFLALLPVIYLWYLYRSRRRTVTASFLVRMSAAPWLYSASSTFLVLWLVYDLRETYNHVQMLRVELRYAAGEAPRPRHYIELDDFYDFIEATKSVVPPESSVGFFSKRPLFVKARYFLYPRPVFNREIDPEYLVVFQDPDVSYRQGQLKEKEVVLVSRVMPFGRFGEDAFIYKRVDP